MVRQQNVSQGFAGPPMSQDAGDILEELFHGDLGFDEMIPVDSFFETYVDQLQQAGPQGMMLDSGIGGSLGVNNVAMYGATGNNSRTNFYSYPQNQQKGFVQQNTMSTPPNSNFAGYGEHGSGTGGGSFTAVGMNALQPPTSFPQTGIMQQEAYFTKQYQATPRQNLSGSAGGEVEGMEVNQGQQMRSSEDDANSNEKNSSDQKLRRIRNRTPKQQAMNKQAQQRYRERKKSRALNMEKTVEALSVEVEGLRAVRDQKIQLEDKASELEQKLVEKEAELNRLKAEIHNHMKGGNSSVGDDSSNNNNSESSADQFDLQKEVEHLASQFHAQVAVLRNTVKSIGIENYNNTDIYGSNMDASALKGIEQLVMDICMVCMRSLRMEGFNVWSLIQATLQTTPNSDRSWNSTSTASRLQLTQEQKQRALALRKDYLKKLDEIFNQRQGLNLQAISVLLPKDQGGHGPNLNKGGSAYSFTGLFSRARHNGRMNSVLEQLRENLRTEQRAASELDYIVFHRLLTPIQASWFVLECYPEHCDCLEFLNGCEQAFGQDPSLH